MPKPRYDPFLNTNTYSVLVEIIQNQNEENSYCSFIAKSLGLSDDLVLYHLKKLVKNKLIPKPIKISSLNKTIYKFDIDYFLIKFYKEIQFNSDCKLFTKIMSNTVSQLPVSEMDTLIGWLKVTILTSYLINIIRYFRENTKDKGKTLDHLDNQNIDSFNEIVDKFKLWVEIEYNDREFSKYLDVIMLSVMIALGKDNKNE